LGKPAGKKAGWLAGTSGWTGEMLKKPQYITLVLVVLLVVVLLNLPSQTSGRLKLAISGLSFLPLFGLATSTHQASAKIGDTLVSKADLLRDNAQLRASNQVLSLQLQQTAEARRRLEELGRFLNNPMLKTWKMRLATIIAREPTSWWNCVWIDRGTRDGVAANFPVLTPDGLVGKVALAGETRSQVVLLGDAALRVSVRVGASNEVGVLMVASSSPREKNMIDLTCLSGASHVAAGDKVVTSGEGGVFPSGIPVGAVVDVFPQDNGLSKQVRVKLFADLGALEDVWVITP
jgi:rod shape-determining protein MreC